MESKKIKICHVANNDRAVVFLLMPQLKFLQAQGFEVYVVCAPGTLVKKIEAENITVKTIKIKRKISPLYDVVSLARLFFYFKKEKFNIVHVHNPKPGLLGQLAAKLAGVPLIINTVHGLYFTEHTPYAKRQFFIGMEKVAAACSSLIFSQNKEDIATLVTEKIARPEKIIYLGNGVDIDKFNPGRFSKEFIDGKKKELGIPADVKVLGIVARLVKEKGYLDLFEAFALVLKKYPGIILLVVGPKDPGKKDGISLDVVEKYGIEKNVIFLGERMDVDQLYPLMDIFVFPSHREGFPRSLLEAMAQERPIIATDIRGCREALDGHDNGMLVPVENPPALSEAIIFLLQHDAVAQKMAKNARIKAVKEFDEKLVFERIKKAYDTLLRV